MPTINKLPLLGTPSGGDQIPVYAPNSGDARRMSITALTDYMQGALDLPGNSDEVSFLQSGTGAVTRTVQSKLRDVVSVRDFGAVGDGVTDDTAAVQAAISFAKTGAVVPVYGAKAVYFPAGTYPVSNGALTYGASATGMLFFGDGPTSSTLKLTTSGASQVYFYDNIGAQSYRNTFQNLRFLGASQTYCNGFRLNDSGGWEKQFRWHNCMFESINTVLTCTGTTNADECTFVMCEWRPVTTLLNVSNAQAMLHNFVACRGTVTGDMWILGANGGGEFHYMGGSIIHSPTGANAYWLNGSAGPATSVQTGNFTFSNVRAELRGQYSKLIYWPVSNAINRSRHVKITFDSVNIATANQGSGTTRTDTVVIGEGKWVTFRDCVLPQVATGTIDDYGYTVTADNASAPGVPNPGFILFDGCSVQANLSSKITITNRYGKVEARNCISNQATAVTDADRRAIDFQFGSVNPLVGSAGSQSKQVFVKRYLWPYSDGAGGFLNEYPVTLPKGALITRAVICKPATGTGSATVQYHIGTDDKATSYVTTASAAQNSNHFKTEDVFLAPLAADTTLRLWLSEGVPNTATGQHEGGYAFIEYT